MDILESMYRRITQPFTKGTIPEIKLKVPFYKEKLQSKVYNSDNELMNYQDIKPGDTLLCIVQVKGLKFLKQEYYCDMCIQQIKVCASPKIATDRCLIVDEDETLRRNLIMKFWMKKLLNAKNKFYIYNLKLKNLNQN